MIYHIPTEVSTLALHFAQGRWHWDTGVVTVRTWSEWRDWQALHYPAPEVTTATFTVDVPGI